MGQDKNVAADAIDFRNALLKRYRNFSEAWDALDTNDNGLLDFKEFVSACVKMQIKGKLRVIFSELSHDGENLRLTDLDASLQDDQERREEERRRKVEERAEARDSIVRLPLLQRLYHTPTIEDEPPPLFDQDAIRSWSKERLPPNTTTTSFSSRSEPAPRTAIRANLAATTGEVWYALSHSNYSGSMAHASNGRNFHQAVIRKYRSLEAGWDDLDKNGDGSLSFQEFVLACRKTQVRGNIREMFSQLCSDEDRGLKMSDLAPEKQEEQERREKAYAQYKQRHEQAMQERERQAAIWRQNSASSLSGSPRHKPVTSPRFQAKVADRLPAISNHEDGQADKEQTSENLE
jgi:hypothetical protein